MEAHSDSDIRNFRRLFFYSRDHVDSLFEIRHNEIGPLNGASLAFAESFVQGVHFDFQPAQHASNRRMMGGDESSHLSERLGSDVLPEALRVPIKTFKSPRNRGSNIAESLSDVIAC